MSQLQSLKSAISLHDVAALLGFTATGLAFVLYRKPAQAKYHSFQIVKRGGGSRQINAPSDDLKLMQRRLSDLLQNCIEEINKSQNLKDQLSHGFKRGRSIISNATKHRKRRFVLNVDLRDFFATINFGRVRGFFLKDRNFALNTRTATILAQIACHQNALPQGSPCSPVISNLIAHVLDIHLVRLAAQCGCTYSRYADDITISTNEPIFPPNIARPLAGNSHVWEIGDDLRDIVTRSGFTINPEKTRMQYRTSRQDVTGLVVNAKVNIRSDYRRRVRAMTHRLLRTGHFEFVQAIPDANGVFVPIKQEGTLAQLHGMLGHINRVDRHNAQLSSHLNAMVVDPRSTGSKENLYRKFLMFKEFYAAPAPVIICEGKTDNVYLLYAIRSLAAAYPRLATVSPQNTITLNIRIFRYPQTSTGRILGLGGGTGDFTNFIHQYVKEANRFQAPGAYQPVVLLIDNDQGAKPVYSSIQQITKKKPSGMEPFIHVAKNLYLVATPRNPGENESVIEQSFTRQTRGVVLGGKTLSLSNNHDPAKHFGKYIFSKYVEQNAANIDFSGFGRILSQLTEAIDANAQAIPRP